MEGSYTSMGGEEPGNATNTLGDTGDLVRGVACRGTHQPAAAHPCSQLQVGDEAGDAAKVLGGGGDRVVFQLAVSLSRLQVVLNYEGARAQSLSQVRLWAPKVISAGCQAARTGLNGYKGAKTSRKLGAELLWVMYILLEQTKPLVVAPAGIHGRV